MRRVCDRLKPNLIISPSHETILPNVPPGNVQALAEAIAEVRSDAILRSITRDAQ